MREIKFRGKARRDGQWFFGNYTDRDTKGRTHICNLNRGCLDIDPETVGQYTGLKDKNGKEIYEGDIMRNDEGHVCEVVWDEFSCGFRQHDHYLELMDNFIEEEFDEVIGNIHDNPELLKED